MKVYDCFLFLNEFELLDMRLKYLDPVVDYFVVVESSHTFSGNTRPYLLNAHKYSQKMIVLQCDIIEPDSNYWKNEDFIRNFLYYGIKTANDDDIIMLSDIDEIPNKNLLTENYLRYINPKNQYSLTQQFYYYYYYNLKCNETWQGTQIVKKEMFDRCGKPYENFSYIRDQRNNTIQVSNGGWHFSYLGGIEKIAYKLKSFSHKEYSNLSIEEIKNAVENNKDLFGRPDMKFNKVDLNEFPEDLNKCFNKEFIL